MSVLSCALAPDACTLYMCTFAPRSALLTTLPKHKSAPLQEQGALTSAAICKRQLRGVYTLGERGAGDGSNCIPRCRLKG